MGTQWSVTLLPVEGLQSEGWLQAEIEANLANLMVCAICRGVLGFEDSDPSWHRFFGMELTPRLTHDL